MHGIIKTGGRSARAGKIFGSLTLAWLAMPITGAAAQSWYSAGNIGSVAPAALIQDRWPNATHDVTPDTVEQRIAALHDAVRITPPQEAPWQAVAQAMRETAASMARLTYNRSAMASGNVIAFQNITILKSSMRDHCAHVVALLTTIHALYGGFSDGQKARAMVAFGQFGTAAGPIHG